MPNYIVNRNAQPGSRDHEVHNADSGCQYMPTWSNQIALGNFSSCSGAVQAAQNYYSDVNGCYYCANDCHTT
ncbi:hypothetical protein QFZ21_002132 [Microbacterium sp. W4I20]|nr:hypothetical protein [Microbacterium sp. W4I20]